MVGKVVTQLAGTIPAGTPDEEGTPHSVIRRGPHNPGVVTIVDTHSVGEGQVSQVYHFIILVLFTVMLLVELSLTLYHFVLSKIQHFYHDIDTANELYQKSLPHQVKLPDLVFHFVSVMSTVMSRGLM